MEKLQAWQIAEIAVQENTTIVHFNDIFIPGFGKYTYMHMCFS